MRFRMKMKMILLFQMNSRPKQKPRISKAENNHNNKGKQLTRESKQPARAKTPLRKVFISGIP